MEATKTRHEKAKQDPAGQIAGNAAAAMTRWVDANQKVLEEMVGLAATTTTHGVRLCSELQSSTVNATKAGWDYWLRRLTAAQEWGRDPLAWYQAAQYQGVIELQRLSELAQENARAVARTADELQGTVEKSAGKVQHILTDLAAELKGLYTPNGA
jgi:hypothetical protein